MTVNLKGQSVSFNVAGVGVSEFMLPPDRAMLLPKVADAFGAVEAARDAEVKVMTKKPNDHTARLEANQAMAAALDDLRDCASVNAEGTRARAKEAYDLAALKLVRAVEQAQQALQAAATAAQLHYQAAHVNGVGIDFRAKSRAMVSAVEISEQLDRLVRLPAIDATPVGRP